MSLAEAYLERVLKLDVESYFQGKTPSRLALAEAPPLERWRVELMYERTEYRSSIILKGAMRLMGHAGESDGEPVKTAPLVWLDQSGSWARTRDGLYRLGHRTTSR